MPRGDVTPAECKSALGRPRPMLLTSLGRAAVEGGLRCEQDAALADEAAGYTTPAASKPDCGEMSNSTSTLVGGVVMSIGEVAPVSVELIDTKGSEGNVANLVISPLVENKPKHSLIVKLESGQKEPPEFPRDTATTNVAEVSL